MPLAVRARLPALIALVALVGAACGGSGHGRGSQRPPTPPPPVASAPTTEVSLAFGQAAPSNWNVLASGAASDGLTAVSDQVWPSVFTFGPTMVPQLNKALIESATVTGWSTQTVVYRINPKATWSDGQPITGTDFVYNWQAQSGAGSITDTGGAAFTPASTVGYSLVQSVTVSPETPDVVTVVFSSPFPDWQSLFRHIVPAHVAQRVGFDSGFTDPVEDLVSGGPYMVAAYEPSGLLRLVRNPSWWGQPASALELDMRFVPEEDQLLAALASGEVGCAEVAATAADIFQLKAAKNLSVSVTPTASYLDLVFEGASGPLSDPAVRQVVTDAVSRQSVASAAVGSLEPGASPVGNRFLFPGEPGYTDNGPPAAGSAGRSASPASLKLAVDAADPVQAAAATAIGTELEAEGFTVTAVAAGAPADMRLEVRTVTPFPGPSMEAFLTGSSSNFAGVRAPALDAAIDTAAASHGTQRPTLVDQADQAAWAAYVDLPLVALPGVFSCQSSVTGAAPNPSPDGPAYNASGWGVSASAS